MSTDFQSESRGKMRESRDHRSDASWCKSGSVQIPKSGSVQRPKSDLEFALRVLGTERERLHCRGKSYNTLVDFAVAVRKLALNHFGYI